MPLAGAVQSNQTEWPPASPACDGSPTSFVAPALTASTAPDWAASGRAAAKSSFAGGGERSRLHASANEPSLRESMRMKYVAPPAAANVIRLVVVEAPVSSLYA